MSRQLKPIPKGKEVTGSVADYIDSRFFGSVDIIGCGDVAVTIDRLEQHDTLEYENGRTDTNVVLIYFKETPKPLKLVPTNLRKIAATLKTKKMSAWKGKKIKLHIEIAKIRGGLEKPAVRVKG